MAGEVDTRHVQRLGFGETDWSFALVISFLRDEQRNTHSSWMKKWRHCTLLNNVSSSHPGRIQFADLLKPGLVMNMSGPQNSLHLWNGKQSRARKIEFR